MSNLETRDPLGIEFDLNSPGGTLRVGLHMINIEAQLFHAPKSFQPSRVFADAAGDDALIAHQRRDVGEVGRSPA